MGRGGICRGRPALPPSAWRVGGWGVGPAPSGAGCRVTGCKGWAENRLAELQEGAELPGCRFRQGPGGEVPAEGGGHQGAREIHQDASETALPFGAEQDTVPKGHHPDVCLGGAALEVCQRGLLGGGEGGSEAEGGAMEGAG